MLFNRLSLRDLEYAVAVAEERHFRRAAERCHVSQPALSAQIRKLEEVLGVVLFERTPRGVLTTPQGSRLLRQARHLLGEAQRLFELAGTEDELAGEFRIDAIATLGPYLFPHILRPLRERYPHADYVLREGRTEKILSSLAAGEGDVALVSLPVGREEIAVIPLFEEPFVVIHPPGMFRGARLPLDLDDLGADNLLLLEEGHCLRDQALDLCRTTSARSYRHATSLETLRHMVAAGAGYSLLPALAAQSKESFGGLVAYAALDDPSACRKVALAFRATDARREHYRDMADTIRASLPATVRTINSDMP
jgi:LysR family transcriptional regulator, hydrogen peroxide-inducible genes activator